MVQGYCVWLTLTVRVNIYACRILVWEDGFCNFAASAAPEINSGDCPTSSVYGNCEFQPYQGLQPELFFKMSHEIYNYGEGYVYMHLLYMLINIS